MNVLSRIAVALAIFTPLGALAQTDSGKAAPPPQQSTHTTVQVQSPAQQIGKVTGKVVDAQGHAVSYATVTLLRADASVVNGDLTKDDGSFTISPTGIGTFTIKVSAIGYKDLSIPNVTVTTDAPTKNIGSIKTASVSNQLKTVTVTGEKPLMELTPDKKVFNVEKNITTAGGSASDVLSNVPSVSVDVDGNVSLRGQGDVTILIDGKPATMLGTDAASALQSLPAASIESVEVITNPSAKYDAQGLTGIINIVTKKDQRFGINGNITLGAGTGDKYNGNLALNAHKGKWNVSLNSSFRLNQNYNNTTTTRYEHAAGNDSLYRTNEHAQRHFNGNFNTLAVGYDINKYQSLTLTENVNVMNFGFNDVADYYTFGNTDNTDMGEHQYRTSHANGGPVSVSSSLDYKAKFKKQGEELDADATYASTTVTHNQYYNTFMYDGGNNPLYGGNPIYENVPGTGGNSSFTGWLDYTDPLFTKNGKLGMGVKTQITNFNSNNNPVVDSPDGVHMVDTSLLANFNYTQQVHAAYADWSDKYGKFSYQVGLRLEDAIYNASDYTPSYISYSKSYLNLFPSAFISYQLSGNQTLNLNYSKRTDRPSFWQLMPYKDVSTPGLVQEGNPFLNPEFIDNIEFSYNKQTKRGDNILIDAYYQYTHNLIEKVTTVLDSTAGPLAGSLFTQPENLAHGITYGLEGTGHIQIIPIWDATVNLNFFQNYITAGNSAYADYFTNMSGFSWIGKINTNIKLPAGLSLQINGNYESSKVVAQGTLQPVWWVDAALRYNLLKGKATIVANISDIFNTRKYTTIYDLPIYYETYYRDRETRVGNLTFTYRFGKSSFGKQGGGRKQKTDAAPQQNEERNDNLKQGDEDQGGGGGQGGPNSGHGGPRS